MAYTTDDLVLAVKRDSFLPAAQSQWSASRILELGDKCILRRVVPAFIGIGDGFYRETADIPMYAGVSSYDIPRYAMLNKIHQAMLVDPSGVKLGTLLRKDPPDLKYWNTTSTGTPVMIRFEGDQLVVNPTPNSGTLNSWTNIRVWIYRRPGRMVPVSSAAVVSGVNSATGVVTYTGAPPGTFTSSSSHDFYRASSPFRRIGTAISASAVAGSTQTFAPGDAELLSAGDYVCLRDETVFPPCSIEIVPFLEELIIKSMSATQGDRAAVEASIKEIMDDMMLLVSSAANRADAMPQVASLLHSPFARGIRRRGMNSVSD